MYTPILYSRIMGCHGHHEISKTKEHSFFWTIFFFFIQVVLLDKIYAHNEMSYVFNLRSDYPVAYYSLPMAFPLIF